MVAGAMVPTAKKASPDSALTPPHTPSAKSPTLKNKAFLVKDHHDPSGEIPEWAMRDSRVHAFKAVNRGLLDSSETEAVSPAVTNPTLSETVAAFPDG